MTDAVTTEEKTEREHLREMAHDDSLDGQWLYAALYEYRYGEEP